MFHAYIQRRKKGNLQVDNTIVSDPGETSDVFADCFGSIYKSVVTDASFSALENDYYDEPSEKTYDTVYSTLCKLNVPLYSWL